MNYFIEEKNINENENENENEYDYEIEITNAKTLCNELLNEINSCESHKLEITNLAMILDKVLKNKFAVNYLYDNYYYTNSSNGRKHNIFKIYYDKLIINKEKNFIYFENIVNDFSLSWLHYIYH